MLTPEERNSAIEMARHMVSVSNEIAAGLVKETKNPQGK
jgi:hypothetical protein